MNLQEHDSRNPSGAPRRRSRGGKFFAFALPLLFFVGIALALYVLYLDRVIRQKFDGKRWALPAVVYARPLELYPGLTLSPAMLEEELRLAGYRRDKVAQAPGGYDMGGNVIHLVTRGFAYPDGEDSSTPITVQFSGPTVAKLARSDTGAELPLARLDPVRIGSFHPRDNEDRILLQREDLPELLVKTLIAVEDQHFYSHFGVDPLGILRALLVNVRAGRMAQGGSTLTQQLVKNLYLSNERSLRRKVNEAIMAPLLEYHYSKDEILTAYANEIFLGQDRGRAVHGLGLASQFYFRRELRDLSPAQIAQLVGMIKGPSWYDPRREPTRCLERRQVVLDLMRGQGVIGDDVYLTAKAAGLEQAETVQSGFNRFPAFLDLVRRQLGQEYREEDLVSNGLKILTTLDPQVQHQVEHQLRETIAALEKRPGSGDLEGAVIVSSREGGEILALAGGRHPLQAGFNRALDARRPIGSLIKPVIYLTALANGYTLATPVQDTALTVSAPGARDWRPANYDRQEHGVVPLYEALAMSYNLSTVRIGMDIGVEAVIRSLGRLGIEREFPPYPSFLLGTAELSPLEVSLAYQVLASGGFYQPQRAIGSVLAADNKGVRRFGLSVEQRFSATEVFLLNTALQRVVSHGTARGLAKYIPETLRAAGKTGTTDELRDSWFAGFTGDRLAVVWIGRDDNKPMGHTGASGAMAVWGRIMQHLPQSPLELAEPEGIAWARPARGLYGDPARVEVLLPFAADAVPAGATRAPAGDDPGSAPGLWDRVRGWFH